jgi:hypothetical protein
MVLNNMCYWNGVRPDGNGCDAIPDLDRAELIFEIDDEFEIKIPDEEMKRMDGKFDAIVRCVASQRSPT